jgi:ferredoxin-NADP reductase
MLIDFVVHPVERCRCSTAPEVSSHACIQYRRNTFCFCITLVVTILALVGPAFGQTPEEHAKHHPAPGMNSASAPGAMGGNQPTGGGMGGGMGEMMKKMGTPPPKELYPSLMALPDEVTLEERARIEQLAHERMQAGTALLASGLGKLSDSTSDEDYAAMQQAAAQMREGLAEFEAGIAARRVLAEGQAPRNLALEWFKREMNLASPIRPEGPRTLLGVAPFHFFTMALLIAFALAMLALYYFKMRRAAALFGRLGPDANPPPPGSSPPLAGAPAPVAPPPGGAPAKPATGTPEASGTPPGGSAVPVPGGDAAKPADKPPAPPAAEGSPPSPATTSPAGPETASVPPVTANWRGQLRMGSIVTETPSVKTLRLLPSSNDRFLPFTFVPGQFLNLSFWIGGARMNRSYSISSSPTQREYVELTVRREPRGAVSRHIDDLLKVGDQIEAGGPVGRFTFTGIEADSIVLIAGGVGITPMMSIIRYLTERSWSGDIYFIYTCRTPADFIFADEVAALQRLNPKLRVAVTISSAEGTDWKGHRGRVTKEWLTQTVPDLASRTTHLCGPPAMMDAIKAIFTELAIPPDRLKTEAFGTPRPAPAAAGTTAKPTAPATGPLVTFSKNNKSARIHIDQTILELSEELAIGIEFSCRVGTCGVCKVKMTSGEVEMAVEDALEPDDKANSIILACQAKPKVDVTVEA